MGPTPLLSIIVIGYQMPRQLGQTLFTLSEAYQQDVSANDYEVIVVENDSDRMLSPEKVNLMGNNFHYFTYHEKGQSPVAAINFAFEKCQGDFIGLLIDGAHMVTPRVVKYALTAYRAFDYPVVVVPGYHLGAERQTQDPTYTQEYEQQILEELNWQQNGYKLFEVAGFSPANKHSYFHPVMECNCVFAPLISFERIGYCDEGFNLKGGGSINLHVYRQLATLLESEIVVLPGEGSFHQFHGGVTTSDYSGRSEEILSHNKQLNALWDGRFKSVSKEPILLGAVTYWAQGFLQKSSKGARRRHERLRSLSRDEWEDGVNADPTIPAKSVAEAKVCLAKRKKSSL